jgi:hypothetical protein
MPFGPYKNFDDCVSKNKDKEDPDAYCAVIKRKIEGESCNHDHKIEAYEQEYKKVLKSTLEKWQQEGYKNIIIKTEGDNRVCPICKKKHNQVISIIAALRNPYLVPPFHNSCRCWIEKYGTKEKLISFKSFKEAQVLNVEPGTDKQNKFEIHMMPDQTYNLAYLVANKGYSLKQLADSLKGNELPNYKAMFEMDDSVNNGYWISELKAPQTSKDKDEYRFFRSYIRTKKGLETGLDGFYEYRKKGSVDRTFIFIKQGDKFYSLDKDKLKDMVKKESESVKEAMTTSNAGTYTTGIGGQDAMKLAGDTFVFGFKRDPRDTNSTDIKVMKVLFDFYNRKKEALNIKELKDTLKKFIKNPIILGLIILYVTKLLSR